MGGHGEAALANLKSMFGLGGALLPVLYCGGLLVYFLGVGGSVKGTREIGLGPTVIGLGVVGLLFCIPLILKIMRMVRGPRAPGADGDAPPSSKFGGGDDDDGDSDARADAVIARYLARQAAEEKAGATTLASASRPAPQSGNPAMGFGRPRSAGPSLGSPSFGRKGS